MKRVQGGAEGGGGGGGLLASPARRSATSCMELIPLTIRPVFMRAEG